MKNKIPDNVVYNEDIQKYDSSIKPYPTNLSAPVITVNDTVAWKNRSIHKVNQKLKATPHFSLSCEGSDRRTMYWGRPGSVFSAAQGEKS